MGFLTQLIESGASSGEVIIELPKPESNYPKGVQLVIDYHKSIGSTSYGFYPRCNVSQVFTDAKIAELKQAICPKCEKLEWVDNRLVPIYKYHGIAAVQVLQGKYTQVSFPLNYAEYDHLDYVYFPIFNDGAKKLITQYANQEAKIRTTIEGAIDRLNVDNVIYKEMKIFNNLMQNFFDYSNEIIGELTVDKYIELRNKVFKIHPELKY